MSRECEFCGKKPLVGNNVSHSKRRTKKVFRPNLKSVRLAISGIIRRVRICTNCLKTYTRKAMSA